MNSPEELECDVLILGGGGAACMAAIAARREGARVLLLDKGQLGKSGCSPNAHGGIAACHKHPRDSWQVQMHDTLLSGGFLNDQLVLETMCAGAPRFLTQLEEFGCLFNREDDGSYSVRNFGGHSYPRSAFCGDETGHEIMIGLRREILRTGVRHMDEVMVVKLLVGEGVVVGALCWDIGKGVFYSIAAPAVVLATGDAAGIWPSNSERQRGDGVALALRAGAELVDMEFIQYHPTHCWWPFGVRGSVSESFRAEGGRLLNSLGERFMEKYEPEKKELATRDRISICIYQEIREGRGAPHGGIFASVAHLPARQIEKRLPVILQKYLNFGIDIRRDPIEIRPQPHYFCGGVRIDREARTSLQGLYAAGAVSGGVHGANRLGSNSLTDILVFGEIAGKNAAHHALGNQKTLRADRESIEPEVRRIEELLEGTGESKVDLPHLRRRHIEMMDRHMGVLRNADGMRTMLSEIERSRGEDLPRIVLRDSCRQYNFELRDALEMSFRMELEEVSTQAALLREESRGCHFREDFPARDDRRWLKNIVFSRVEGDLRQETRTAQHPLVSMEEFPEYARSKSPWHGYTG